MLPVGQNTCLPPFTLENCSFLKEAQRAVDEFRDALWNGMVTLKQNSRKCSFRFCHIVTFTLSLDNFLVKTIGAIWSSCQRVLLKAIGPKNHEKVSSNLHFYLRHICHRISLPDLENPVVMRICKFWGVCTAGLVYQNGSAVHGSLKILLQERKSHPVEFQATIPTLNASALRKVVRYMNAAGYLYLTFESAHANDPVRVRYNINKAVAWYHRAGISDGDISLINFRKMFIDHADRLEAIQKRELSTI